MKKNKKRILTIIGIIILILIIWYALIPKTDKRILRFEDEFGFNLPKDTKIIFSDSDYGSMGDGIRLYVFQLTASEMKPLITYKKIGGWYPLPINKEMAEGLHQHVDGLSSSRLTNKIDFNIQKGYYIIKNSTYNRPLLKYNFDDQSYYNVVIGMIDTQKNLIYFCTWDM